MGKYQIWPLQKFPSKWIRWRCETFLKKISGQFVSFPLGKRTLLSGRDVKTATSMPNKDKNVHFVVERALECFRSIQVDTCGFNHSFAWLYILFYEYTITCLSISGCLWGVMRGGMELSEMWLKRSTQWVSAIVRMLYFLSWVVIMQYSLYYFPYFWFIWNNL